MFKKTIIILLVGYSLTLATAQTTNCSYENKTSQLGLGIVEWNSDKEMRSPFLELYNDAKRTQLYEKWSYYDGSSEQPICTKFYKPDYGIVQAVCLEENDECFTVLINFDEVKYIPNNGNYRFKVWESYLQESHGIRRKYNAKESIQQPLREGPTSSGNEIQLPKEQLELFCISQIKGDWIEVIYDCFYNREVNEFEGMACKNYIDKCDSPIKGWLKWRSENEILIDIFTMP